MLRLSPLAIATIVALQGCAAVSGPAVAAAPGAVQALAGRSDGVTGDIHVHRDIASKFLSKKRDLYVYTPPGYGASNGKRYPVLYMHDGNNLFDPRLAFMGQEWHVDETVERMIRAGELPPMIVVGVANTPDRLYEYTWVKGELDSKEVAGGRGASYARFMVEELKPLIDRTYRTKPGRTDTGVMGSSLGGLQSFYMGRYHGEVFGKLGVMSPSIWWSDRAVLKEVPALGKDLKIWLDMGRKEGGEPETNLADARALDKALVARGYVDGENLEYVEDPDGEHNERAWARRLPVALKYLFGDQ